MAQTVEMFTIQILAPQNDEPEQTQSVMASLPARLAAIEEDLTDLLPEGWSAKIAVWWSDDKEGSGQ